MSDPVFSYFKYEDFACKCCGRNVMDIGTVKRLDMSRAVSRVPYVISSGYRCPKHNQEVGGEPDSSHLKGLAADIEYSNSSECFLILSALLKVGFTRIGIGKNFIHCDTDITKTQNVIWDYYPKSDLK